MANEAMLFSLLQGIQTKDPRTHDLLREIIRQIALLNGEVFPPPSPVQTVLPEAPVIPDPLTFTYELVAEGVKFTWSRASFDTVYFELRKGSVWETADRILITSTTSAVYDPLLVGTHRFLLRGVGLTGELSAGTLTLDVLVPPLGSISANANVIDNNVLLYWNAPTSSFRIDYYELDKSGIPFGTTQATFATSFELASGTYLYGITAYDIAGNASPRTEVPATVSQPPDYILLANEISDFDGTRVNVELLLNPARLLACVNTETWAQHFESRGWTNIQDQINAGFPIYTQPSAPTGSYEEVFDYGTIISNLLVSVVYTFQAIAGTVQVVVKIAVSDDNVTYTAFSTGTSYFATSLRYVKVRMEFTALS